MPKRDTDQVKSVKALLDLKMSYRAIAGRVGVSKSKVQRIASGCGLVSENKAGRKKILSSNDVTFCVTQLSTKKVDSCEKLTKMISEQKGRSVSPRTVSRELHNAGLRSGSKKKKPMISQKNKKERLAFAKAHQDWSVDDWKRVIFSDETKINRFGSDGRSWTWFREGESLQPKNVQQTVKHGGGSLMVWGCITSGGVGYLTEIEGIMDQHLYKEILAGELADTIEYNELDEEKVIFQHDNDPKHTAKSVTQYLSEQEFRVMNWPAQSPDLNPIENCWSYVKQKLYSYPKPASGLIELWERMEEEWEKIPKEYIENLYLSMNRRMKACIKAKGYWTKY